MSAKTTLVLTLLSSFLIYCLNGEDLSESDALESSLPRYMQNDGIKRVTLLTTASFHRTLKHSKLSVVLFYLISKEHPESEKAWKSDEQLLEVRNCSASHTIFVS